jgi:hypothetical protein
MSRIDFSRINSHDIVDVLVRPMTTSKANGITTAINLLESARVMRRPADVRRNLLLARSALYDAISMIDHPLPAPDDCAQLTT